MNKKGNTEGNKSFEIADSNAMPTLKFKKYILDNMPQTI